MTTFARTKLKGTGEKSDCEEAWGSSGVLVHRSPASQHVLGGKRGGGGGGGEGEETAWGFLSFAGKGAEHDSAPGCLKPWLAGPAGSVPSARRAAGAVSGA